MRIGMATTDGVYVNEHFGNAKYWDIYELDEESEFVETRMVRYGCNCHDPKLFDDMLKALDDCEALFVSRIGEVAANYLMSKGKRIFEAAGPVDGILEQLQNGEVLKKK